MFALAGCAPSPGYVVVCDDGNAGRELADRECDRIAAAAVGDLDATQSAAMVAVVTYRWCAPGAFCPILPEGESYDRISALIGVRLNDRSSIMRHALDIDAWPPLSFEPVEGYDAADFVDAYGAGKSQSAAGSAMRSP